MNPGIAFVSGLVAGVAVAGPLGAIGVLLLREGLRRGLRGGLPAAAAVASVDVLYAAAAVVLGAVAAPLVLRWAPYPALAGGAALVAVATAGLARSLRSAPRPEGSAGPSEPPAEAPTGRGLRRFALFFGLTMVNPATLVYFAAIAAGLPQLSGEASSGAAFVVGVGVASFAWQALLVSGGGFLRGRARPGLRRWSGVAGSVAVGAFGLLLVAGAVP